MKKLTLSLVGLAALTYAVPALADDVVRTETKQERRTTKKKVVDRKEVTETTDPEGALNSTTDKEVVERESKATPIGGSETTVEKTSEHDAPGVKHDEKTKTKRKIVKDANGNVIGDETIRK